MPNHTVSIRHTIVVAEISEKHVRLKISLHIIYKLRLLVEHCYYYSHYNTVLQSIAISYAPVSKLPADIPERNMKVASMYTLMDTGITAVATY